MPKATLTSRVLKNKDTGLEIQVPSYSVKKEVLSSVVHYQVVLASNLACFKLPSHKESDVVQYSVGRRFNEFEELKSKLQGQFPSTMLPPINKRSIIVNEVVLRERRASLDHFMKSVASIPNLATCVYVLEFLGVERLRARKFNKGEPLDNRASAPADDHSTIGATEGESESTDPIVFGDDEDSGNEDLFGDDSGKDGTDDLFGNDEEDEDSRPGNVKIFQRQDLKRDLTEEDEKDFTTFIPDAILTKTETVRTQEEEDNSDLFQIEDDLDKLMTVKTETQKSANDNNTSTAASSSSPSQPPPKPSSKPSPPTKPLIPSKPKPQIASKPKNLTSSQSTDKPDIPQKPKPSSSSSSSSAAAAAKSSSITTTGTVSKSDPFSSSEGAVTTATSSVGAVDNLGQDDIMKYLQDNLDSNAEEVDLFS